MLEQIKPCCRNTTGREILPVCVCVCVCVRERKREIERGRERVSEWESEENTTDKS